MGSLNRRLLLNVGSWGISNNAYLLLLAGNGNTLSLPRASVVLGPLAAHGEARNVAPAAVALDVFQPLDGHQVEATLRSNGKPAQSAE